MSPIHDDSHTDHINIVFVPYPITFSIVNCKRRVGLNQVCLLGLGFALCQTQLLTVDNQTCETKKFSHDSPPLRPDETPSLPRCYQLPGHSRDSAADQTCRSSSSERSRRRLTKPLPSSRSGEDKSVGSADPFVVLPTLWPINHRGLQSGERSNLCSLAPLGEFSPRPGALIVQHVTANV